MTLTLTIADNTAANRMVDGLCDATGWTAASGMTKGEWVKDKLIGYLKQFAIRGESKTTFETIKNEIQAIVIT